MFAAEVPPYPGGIATYCYEVTAAATRLGHEVTLFAFTDDADASDVFEVVRLQPFQLEISNTPLATIAMVKQLRKRRFDLLVAVDLKTMVAASLLPWSIRKRAIVHGTDVKSKIVRHILRPFKPYSRFERILSNSAFTRDLLLQHQGYVVPDRVAVAPLGVDRFWFEAPALHETHAIQASLGALDNRFVIVSVGRLEARKGHLQTIAALKRLPDVLRHMVTYIIVGRPVGEDYKNEVSAAAATTDADVRVIADISRGELRALYARADLLAHTATRSVYRAEGFGLVILEAAAAGVAALATRVDALPEVIVEGSTGLLSDDGDIEALSSNLMRFMSSKTGTTRLFADACRSHAEGFSWDRCAEITLA